MEAGTGIDSLGVFLTGGSTNTDPASSLGGAPSACRVRGLIAIVSATLIPSIRIDNVWPDCGEGDASLVVDADGALVFTPPGAASGSPVSIAAGESKVITGADRNKAIRVYREAGLAFSGRCDFKLVTAMNGAVSMANLTSAQRAAGRTTYRAIALRPLGVHGVLDVRLWVPPLDTTQVAVSLGVEVPSGGLIQTVANEITSPSGISWQSPTSRGSALVIPSIDSGTFAGLWIRRVTSVSGRVAPRTDLKLSVVFKGA